MPQSLSHPMIRASRANAQRNRLAVFEALMDLQPATLRDLADATKLPVTTVHRHLSALVDVGEAYCIKGVRGRVPTPDRFRVELNDAARRAAAAQARMLRSPAGGAAA